jgi:hypothetical protein
MATNKGTGAGGKNTNVNGKSFEDKTDNKKRLLKIGYKESIINAKKEKSKYNFYLEKDNMVYVTQNGFKTFCKKNYNIDAIRNPDEAYIIKKDNKTIIKILEKKAQNMEGSVETKLWACIGLKREYEIDFGENFIIEYAFCLSTFLQKKIESNDKKYIILKRILEENNIKILYGDDEDYFDKLDNWINNSL